MTRPSDEDEKQEYYFLHDDHELLSVAQFCYLEFFSNTLKTTLLDRGGYFYQHVNALACTKIIILLSSFEGKKKEIEEIRKQFSQKYLFCLLMM